MALQATISLSNNNPQSGQSVTASVAVSGQSGTVSYQWKLGSSNVPGAVGSSYVYSLSDGDNKISCVVTDSVTSVTPARNVFVGNLSGANSTPLGGTEQYTTNIPSPKWSTNSVDPNKNTISAGLLTKNKAESLTVTAREELWTSLGAATGTVSRPDNSVSYGTFGADFDTLNANIWLKNDGDFIKFPITTVPNPGLTFARIIGSATWLSVYFSGSIVDSNGDLIGSFSPVVGKIVRIEQFGNNYKIFYDGNLIVTTVAAPPALADSTKGNFFRLVVYNLPANSIIPKPTFLSSTIPEKFSTKSVTVFQPPPADVTNLTIDANRNLDSDDALHAAYYRTQRRIDGGEWADLTPIIRAFQDNENLPTLSGTYQFQYRRKAVNSSGGQSVNWSPVASLNYVVAAPSITITSPANNQTLIGVVDLAASVANFPGAGSVTFKLDDAPIVSPLNTAAFKNGDYTLRAFVGSGGNEIQTAINIAIKNPITIGAIFKYDELQKPETYTAPYFPGYAFRDHTYEDDGRSFNELSDTPTFEWTETLAPIDPATSGAALIAHYNTYRTTRAFSWKAKDGTTYANVFYKSKPEVDYPLGSHRSDVWRVKINLIRYP